MTDFARVEKYYSQFDEWSRLDTPEGRLEFSLLLGILERNLSPGSAVLDLGGGPGRHTVELSKRGFKMSLGDLSPDLVEIAREKARTLGNMANIDRIDVVNALDLSIYGDGAFDAVLLFGPLYHLTGSGEIETCLREARRVLKPGGQVFAIYMPWAEGVRHIIDRSFFAPEQVDAAVLERVLAEGVFNNLSRSGFQEGMFLKTEAVREFFAKAGFEETGVRSIRSLGFEREEKILALEAADADRFRAVMTALEKTAAEPGVVDFCGHAIYMGKKKAG